nr:MAG TPA: hypothetical protein [Caudoviricetes sp.]
MGGAGHCKRPRSFPPIAPMRRKPPMMPRLSRRGIIRFRVVTWWKTA